jgi:type I restriction enzyme S subunit
MLIRKSPTFDSQWLCDVMNSDVVGAQVDAVNHGAAQKQFNIGDAADFLLPVPPLDDP